MRVSQTKRSVVDYLRKRPFLTLFAILLVAFTLIGANQVSSAGGVVRQASPSASQSPVQVSKPRIYVHVIGEVRHPGLYLIESGSRLTVAIDAAGGFTSRAEPASVNLARELTDGEQFAVLSKTEYVGAIAQPAAAGGASRVSLNRATESELESLPRVGPALAARIIDWRSSNGGFKQVRDLTKVSGFGDKMFAAVKDLVTL